VLTRRPLKQLSHMIVFMASFAVNPERNIFLLCYGYDIVTMCLSKFLDQ